MWSTVGGDTRTSSQPEGRNSLARVRKPRVPIAIRMQSPVGGDTRTASSPEGRSVAAMPRVDVTVNHEIKHLKRDQRRGDEGDESITSRMVTVRFPWP